MNNSYKGKILISTPDISGDIFSRSVVLIIEHDAHGAFGFILNKKNYFLSDNMKHLIGHEIDVYEGGPVENDRVFFLVKGKPITSEYLPIDENFYLTEQQEEIVSAMVDRHLSKEELKIFTGYSGWSPYQLDQEVQNKMWTVVDLFQLDYTSPNDHTLWKKIMQNLGGDYLLWANSPEDVSLN